MQRKGYSKLEDLRGIALDKIYSKAKLLDRYTPMVAIIDEDLCTGCGACIDVCYQEATCMKENVAQIERERCIGCELCMTICPVNAPYLKARGLN